MGRFNRTQNELQEARRQLEERVASPTIEETPSVVDTALTEQVSVLTNLLLEERNANARTKVLQDFPHLKVFEDLLVADTPEELREVAGILSDRLKQVGVGSTDTAATDTTTTETPADQAIVETASGEPPASTEAPVTGGGQTFSTDAAISDRLVEAVKNKDFGSFLKASREKAVLDAEGVLED
jgi:hypothetical protein